MHPLRGAATFTAVAQLFSLKTPNRRPYFIKFLLGNLVEKSPENDLIPLQQIGILKFGTFAVPEAKNPQS